MIKIINCFKLACLLIILSFHSIVYADFSIKAPCQSDSEIADKTGQKYKFYASLLAYNSEPPRCLKLESVITVEFTEEAELSNDEITNDAIVHIILTENGKQLFADYTSIHLNSELAIVVDNKILTMLSIPQPILNGSLIIRGLWYEDAVRLRNAINLK